MKKIEAKKKRKKGKGCLTVVGIFLIIGLLGSCFNSETDSTNQENNTTVIEKNTTETTTEEATTEATTTEMPQPEPNSSAMVDSIAIQAKKDSENATTEKRDEYVKLIAKNYPNFYESNELMEQLMYAGCYLEYGFKGTTYGELGMDTNQAIKYVYRNVEKPDDNATLENLKQIKESLTQLGIQVQ